MWELQKHGPLTLGTFLADCVCAAGTDCHTVLLSGEDFENCLIDISLALEVEAQARAAGFGEVEWVVVARSVEAYVPSIYSEMSKHGVVLQQETLERAAAERGCFYLSTSTYNYIFALDYRRFSERFARSVRGRLVEFRFEDFLRDFPGAVLLTRILDAEAFGTFCTMVRSSGQKHNERLDDRQIEANYLATALGVARLAGKRYRFVMQPLIWLRRAGSRRRRRMQKADRA